MNTTSINKSASASAYCILADDREREVVPHIDAISSFFPGFDHRVERLEIGDYAISYKGHIIAVFERKTWRDLAASIKDGRNTPQKAKMNDLRASCGCKVFYLIEGRRPTKQKAGVPVKTLQSYLDHVVFRDEFHVEYTTDEAHTATRLFELCANLSTITPKLAALVSIDQQTGAEGAQESNEGLLKKREAPTDELIIHNMLCAIPYVSRQIATIFVDKGINLADLVLGRITADEIAILRYPSGSIIGKNATKILKNAKLHKSHLAILAEIPLISRGTAAKLFEEGAPLAGPDGFERLLRGEIQENLLANVKKTEKTRVGPKAASNIVRWAMLSSVK
jgi:ERCC4-type nuclease